MARVYMPLGSFDAKGQIAKGLIFSKWRGVNYVKRYFIPANPQTTAQVNLRTAWELAVANYQGLAAPNKAAYDDAAKGKAYSGFNFAIKRYIDEYMIQLGTGTLPASVTNVGIYPSDVFTWT